MQRGKLGRRLSGLLRVFPESVLAETGYWSLLLNRASKNVAKPTPKPRPLIALRRNRRNEAQAGCGPESQRVRHFQ
jgi:hypothetical protein